MPNHAVYAVMHVSFFGDLLSDAWWASLPAWLVYLLVIGIVFVETGLLVGAFFPGDTILFIAGGLAALPNASVNVWALSIGVFLAAFIGDQVGYVTGRKLGRPWLQRQTSPRMRRALERTESFHIRYGWWAVIVGRYIPWVRTFIPVVAGVGRMPYFSFLYANLVGALCWGAGMPLLGYWSFHLPWVKKLTYVVFAIFVIGSAISAIRWSVLDRRERRNGGNAAGV